MVGSELGYLSFVAEHVRSCMATIYSLSNVYFQHDTVTKQKMESLRKTHFLATLKLMVYFLIPKYVTLQIMQT